MRKITPVGRARRVELILRIASIQGASARRAPAPDRGSRCDARSSRLLPAMVVAFLVVTLMVPGLGADVALAQATDEPTPSPSPTPSEPESRLAFQPEGLRVELKRGESAISTVELAASDDAEVAFTVSDDRRWLQVAPASGTTPETLELTVDAAGIRPGRYSAAVEAAAEGHEPGTLVVNVIVRKPVTEPDDDKGDDGKPDRKPPPDGDTGGKRPGGGSKGGGGGSGSRDRAEASVKTTAARGIDPRSGDAYWDLVAECESSGRWDLNSGNGYFGGLQFDRWTWKRHGGREYAPRADFATRRQQITVAKRVGYDAWPNCPFPLAGTFTTVRLEAAAARLRELGWDGADIMRAVYTPFITGGPAAWSDTWGAPRYGPGPVIRSHEGQDVFCDFGTPVLASAEGTIQFDEAGLGGRVARLHRPDGSYFYYGHLLDWNRDDFSDGDRVEPGDVIGYCGNTGNAVSTPPHVHFGWYRADRTAADPMAFLVSWLRAAERRAERTVAAATDGRVEGIADAIAARRFGEAFAPDLSEVTPLAESGGIRTGSLFGALIESALHSATAVPEAPAAASFEGEPMDLPPDERSSPRESPSGAAAQTEHFGIDLPRE